MRIGIVGGGHTGAVYAGYLARHGHETALYTRQAAKWKPRVHMQDLVSSQEYTAYLAFVTSDPAELIDFSDVIIVTLPVYAVQDFFNRAQHALAERHTIVLSPGNSAREFTVNPVLAQGAAVIGLQRVMFISRSFGYGDRAVLSGVKKELVAAELTRQAGVRDLLQELFHVPVRTMPTYLPISLGASNPILHSSRLREITEQNPGNTFSENIPFYEGWGSKASDYFFKMNAELVEVARGYAGVGGDLVPSLTAYYESRNQDELTAKIRGITAFKGIGSPMISDGDGYRLNYSSRYFKEDIAFGLSQIAQLGKLIGIATPNIDATLSWAFELMDPAVERLNLKDVGLDSAEKIMKFYSQ